MTPHAQSDPARVRVAVLTVSDSRTLENDASGDAVVAALDAVGYHVVVRALAKDDEESIRAKALELLADANALVVTGGTGLAPRDVTPEALVPLFEKSIVGFGERFRQLSRADAADLAMLSRADAGVLRVGDGRRAVFLLPGAPAAAGMGTRDVVAPILAHVIEMLEASRGR